MHNTSILIHDMTATVLYDLLYSVCHRIDQRLTLYSDFGIPIPYSDYCLYKVDFGCTVFTVKLKFNYRPQILNWIEIWGVHWPIQNRYFHFLHVIPSLSCLMTWRRVVLKHPRSIQKRVCKFSNHFFFYNFMYFSAFTIPSMSSNDPNP